MSTSNTQPQINLIQTVLQKVAEFRAAVGFGYQDSEVHECLYASESIELLTADSHAETADALADMAVVMAGHHLEGEPYYDFEKALLGLDKQAILNKVNLLEAFNIVMASNMSKVCSKSHVIQTTAKYADEGVSIYWIDRDNGLQACYSAHNYPDKPKGKLLKPVTYQEPDWSGDTWKLKDDPHHWNKVEHLPPIGLFLVLRLNNGSEKAGLRTAYIKSRLGDLGYCAVNGDSINSSLIKEWRYE
jgi:hypothetical protein